MAATASYCSEKVILRACVLVLWIFFCMQTATYWNIYNGLDVFFTVSDVKRLPEGSELIHMDIPSMINRSITTITNNSNSGGSNNDSNNESSVFLYPWSSDLDEVRILQYDRYCSNRNVHRHSLVAGLYNTGTNALYQMLGKNCNRKTYLFLWQPEWGKHETFSIEKFNHWNAANNKKAKGIYKDYYAKALSIVIVKDPYTWIKSMCKANYDFRYTDRKWFKQCPKHMSKGNFNWIPLNRAKVMNRGPNRTSNGYFESPLGVWNAFYESWMIQYEQQISPTIFVRFEDLLFRPTETVTKICHCMGNNELQNRDGSVNIYEEKSKPHGKSNNRNSAMQTYSNPRYRYTDFLPEDIEYVEQNVNRTILELFAYDQLSDGG